MLAAGTAQYSFSQALAVAATDGVDQVSSASSTVKAVMTAVVSAYRARAEAARLQESLISVLTRASGTSRSYVRTIEDLIPEIYDGNEVIDDETVEKLASCQAKLKSTFDSINDKDWGWANWRLRRARGRTLNGMRELYAAIEESRWALLNLQAIKEIPGEDGHAISDPEELERRLAAL
jgi:hypothetical protein